MSVPKFSGGKTIIASVLIAAILFSAMAFLYWYLPARVDTPTIDALAGNLLLLATAIGALIATTISYLSNSQSQEALYRSLLPVALFQVESRFTNDGQNLPRTVVHYRSLNANEFANLSVSVNVQASGGARADLSDLFSQPLNLPPLDTRTRTFDTCGKLSEKNFELEALAKLDQEITLTISYSFDFFGRREVRKAQDYMWDSTRRVWEIA